MKRVTFLARFNDGDQEMRGYEFVVNGVAYVVHKGREPWEKHYFVSAKETGQRLTMEKSEAERATTQQRAIEMAKIYLGAA